MRNKTHTTNQLLLQLKQRWRINTANCPLKAFTLVEMIIVIGIISTLLAMLYGALERANKFSRRTITYTELKTIESAFKQYKAHYHTWPTNSFALYPINSNNSKDQGFIIDEQIAKLLQGHLAQGVSDHNAHLFNPEMIPFLELTRYSPLTRAPVNPFKSNNPSQQDTSRAYKVLFDTNGDRQIQVPADPNAPDSETTNVISEVVV